MCKYRFNVWGGGKVVTSLSDRIRYLNQSTSQGATEKAKIVRRMESVMIKKRDKAVAFRTVLFRWTVDLNTFQIVTKNEGFKFIDNPLLK
jgi:hypothetical protein